MVWGGGKLPSLTRLGCDFFFASSGSPTQGFPSEDNLFCEKHFCKTLIRHILLICKGLELNQQIFWEANRERIFSPSCCFLFKFTRPQPFEKTLPGYRFNVFCHLAGLFFQTNNTTFFNRPVFQKSLQGADIAFMHAG
jgi:hypothetical protein